MATYIDRLKTHHIVSAECDYIQLFEIIFALAGDNNVIVVAKNLIPML